MATFLDGMTGKKIAHLRAAANGKFNRIYVDDVLKIGGMFDDMRDLAVTGWLTFDGEYFMANTLTFCAIEQWDAKQQAQQ